jgi:DNA adenine methylase
MNFWRVLQNPDQFAKLHRRLEATPLSRVEWTEAIANLDKGDAVDRAAAYFISCRQSMAGRGDSFTPVVRTRLRRGMSDNVSAWLTAIDGLPAVHTRLKRVFIENMDAIELIKREDKVDTFQYCDPPYFPDSRTSPDVYRFEMTAEQHRAFLNVALCCKAKVMISGYHCSLYDTLLASWKHAEIEVANSAASGDEKQLRTEVLWMNF